MSSTNLPARRGIAVLIVLVILMVFGVMLSLAMQTNLAARAESRRAAQRLQAEYLATAGLELAVARLAADSAYAGETWDIPASELGTRDRAQVVMEITAVAEHPEQRQIRVVAVYPVDEDAFRQQRYRAVHHWNSDPQARRSEP